MLYAFVVSWNSVRLGCHYLKCFDFTNLVASFVKHLWFHGPVHCHMRYSDFIDLVVVM
jgi:hypothetical protein